MRGLPPKPEPRWDKLFLAISPNGVYAGTEIAKSEGRKKMAEIPDNTASQRAIEIGYQKAVDLWMHEARLFWSQFNVMLVINTLIVTIANNKSWATISPPYVPPIIGVALCIVWAIMMSRTSSYNRYWIYSAKELERKLSSATVKTVSRGEEFSAGKTVDFDTLGNSQQFRMNRLGRIVTTQALSFSIILIFLAAHLFNFYKGMC